VKISNLEKNQHGGPLQLFKTSDHYYFLLVHNKSRAITHK